MANGLPSAQAQRHEYRDHDVVETYTGGMQSQTTCTNIYTRRRIIGAYMHDASDTCPWEAGPF